MRAEVCTVRLQVAIWKADAEMRPVLVASTEQPKMTISHAIFADSGVSSSSSNSGSAESDKGSARCQVFFAATADQATAIKVVDEAGRCTAVQVGGRADRSWCCWLLRQVAVLAHACLATVPTQLLPVM